jgi:inosose dehydratase
MSVELRTLQAGCQTFTWEMLGDAWTGDADDLLRAVAEAGYVGIEITDTMIGTYAGRPEAFRTALAAHGLTLVAFACGSSSGFTEKAAITTDLAMIDRALLFTAAFPGAHFSLGSATVMSAGERAAKFEVAAHIYNEAGRHGAALGVPVAFHPSSHHNTLLFDRADYDRIMALTDPDLIGWVPDTGHILRGGQDVAETMQRHLERIRYVHLKDVDAAGQWRMLGDGVCDVGKVIEVACQAPNFNGWLVLEEESAQAAQDPGAAVKLNRTKLRSFGL